MDLSTVGRTRDEERAVLEELSSARPVGATDRRWLLALAGIAALVCFGFVSSAMAPPTMPAPGQGTDRATPRADHRPATADHRRSPEQSGAPAIELLQPLDAASVTGGYVPISLRTTAIRRVQVSVTLGDAVLGWRNVAIDPSGTWTGFVRVFAPPVAIPATIRAVAVLPGGAVEADKTITLDGGAEVVMWDVSVVTGADRRSVVEFRASAPLAFSHVTAWVMDAADHGVGKTVVSSHIDAMLAGSAGGRKMGLGTLSGTIQIRDTFSGWLTLHLAWLNPVTGVRGFLDCPFDPNASSPPGG